VADPRLCAGAALDLEEPMPWRKWMVRGVVYGIIALCGGGALAYQRLTNPAAVREQVLAKLSQLFPGAEISVDSARLRILGGIQLTHVRFWRRDDPERAEFLYVPSAVIYHDKEKVLDGQLALRKIELYKPRLRVRRDRDGKWNMRDLTAKMDPTKPLPTVVVQQGTILFEDHHGDAGAPLIEVGDVHLTLINDPVLILTARGSASAADLGKLRLQATIRRAPLQVAVNFQADGVPIGTALVRRVAGGHAALLDGLAIEALADAHGELSYRPGPEQSVYYDVHCTLRGGKLQHARLPLPLEELSTTLHCAGGRLRVEGLRARAGAVEISADGAATLPAPDQDFEAHVEIKHLTLGEARMCERLPEKLRKLNDMFKPHGPATLVVACARRGGAWCSLADGSASRVSIRPEDASMCFVKFPYRLDHLTGVLDYNLSDRHLRVDVAGKAGGQAVFIEGTWQGEGKDAEARFDIQAADVPIDDALLAGLVHAPAAQKLARSFHATGKADIKAHIRHDRGAGAAVFRNEYHAQIHDATLRWDAFPCPLKQVRGVLDIYPTHWEFREFHATHHGGQVDAHGHSIHGQDAKGVKTQGIALEITGRNVPLDEDLRQGLTPLPGLLKSWDTFRPQGRLNFVASVKRPTPESAELDVRVDAQGFAVEPGFFPLLIHDIGGQFHYHHNRLDLTQIKAWHHGALLTLGTGAVDIHAGGGYFADLTDIQARDLRIDDDLVKALPGKVRDAARVLKLRDTCAAKTRLVIAQAVEPGSLPDVYWDGQAWFDKTTLSAGLELSGVTGTVGCVGRYDGRQLLGLTGNILLDNVTVLKQPFRDVQIGLEVRKDAPDVLLVGVKAPLFGGDVAGQVRVDFNSTLRYEVNLTASKIDLKEFGRHNLGPKSEIAGLAVGRVHLTGQGSGIDTLDGNGSIDVPAGHLYNLPLLLDLLKFLGLHWPDRTAFEELHALFGIHGRRVELRKLDLLGNAISLSGKGEFNLDGTDLQVDCYPAWRAEQFLPPALRPLPSAVSKSILTIEMRGKVGDNPDKDLRFTKRWVPIVLDPLMNLQQRIVGEPRLEKKD
jgi:hypothetical protein